MLFACLVLPAFGAFSQEKIVLITHKDNPISEISKSALKRIFLKEVTSFPNGLRAAPLDQSDNSPIREEFARVVMDSTADQLKERWIKQKHAGDAAAPPVRSSSVSVVSYVANLKGAVGYVYADQVNSSVKVVRVIDVPTFATQAAVNNYKYDVYILYTGVGKPLKSELTSSLPVGFSIKSYNVDLLSLSDASGIGRVIGKFSAARVVVLIGDAVQDILKGQTLQSELIVMGSQRTDVKSARKTVTTQNVEATVAALGSS